MSENHGNTPAAWTAVFIALAGFLVGGIALMLSPVSMLLFWVGLALLPIALVAFVVMTRLGMGDVH